MNEYDIEHGTLGATMLGDLGRARPYKSKTEERRSTPHGCQWSRDCELCPWSDCVISSQERLLKYDSDEAKKLRAELLNSARSGGASVRDLSAMLRMSESAVKRQVETKAAVSKTCRNAKIIRMHTADGITVAGIAREFDVHIDTVARVLRSALGSSGQRGRHRSPKAYPAPLCRSSTGVLDKELGTHNLTVMGP